MRAVAFGLLLSCCIIPSVLAAAPAPRASLADRCPAPEMFVTPPRPLSHIATAIQSGRPVRILAIGSGTTSGQDESGAAAYPGKLLDALRTDLPKAKVELTVRGERGMTAAEMLPLIEAELAAQRFDLVIWQTGTVEAVRGISPGALEATLQDGAAKLAAAGTDLILIGPQYSRLLAERAQLEPYTAALEAASAAPGSVLFDRMNLTRSWVGSGKVDLEHVTDKSERQTMLELLHACVGDALARFILNGGMRH